MLLKTLVSSFAFLSWASALEYSLYQKRAPSADLHLAKRESIELAPGLSLSTSATGLTSTVIVDVTYTYNISVAGYVVAPNFDLEAADYGFSVVSEYTEAADLLENLDKWQFLYQADGGLVTLLTPDCSNTFTLLASDGTVLTWDVCYSINSLASEFTYLSTASESATATSPSGETVVETGTVITSEESTTTDTIPCPICTGEPTTYFIFTATETVEGVSTATVTVPCSTKTGYPVTEPIGEEVYTHSTSILNGATVTVTVPCGCAAGGTKAASLTTTKGAVYTVVPAATEGTSTSYETITQEYKIQTSAAGVISSHAVPTANAVSTSTPSVLEGAGSSFSSSNKYFLYFSMITASSIAFLLL